MTMQTGAEAAPLPSGIVTLRRSTAGVLANVVRNPLLVVPAASFHQRMVLTRNAGRLRAYISDPALIHEVLVRGAGHLAKSREMKRVLGQALGDGLLTADGAGWRWQRQALAPAFQPDRLAALTAPMIAAATVTRDLWLAQAAKDTSAKGPSAGSAVVDVGHAMMHTTFAIILDTMLSGSGDFDADVIEGAVTDFLGATSWMFALAILDAPRWLPFPGRGRAEAAMRLMRRAVRDRIAARRAAPASDAPPDLVATLLAAVDPETGRRLGDDEIADNILTFIAAGHETTAVALTWTLSLLADNPDCAARLRAEVDRVTGGAPLSPAHVEALPYARQVVSEAMRLYPPAPMIARAVEREMSVGGVTLPAGSIVFVPVYAVHRHSALWSEPDRFDPERFASEAVRARHRFSYLPFGAGPRICIGSAFALNEAVAILAVIAGRFTFERVDAAPPEPVMRVTLRPRQPLRLRFTPRAS